VTAQLQGRRRVPPRRLRAPGSGCGCVWLGVKREAAPQVEHLSGFLEPEVGDPGPLGIECLEQSGGLRIHSQVPVLECRQVVAPRPQPYPLGAQSHGRFVGVAVVCCTWKRMGRERSPAPAGLCDHSDRIRVPGPRWASAAGNQFSSVAVTTAQTPWSAGSQPCWGFPSAGGLPATMIMLLALPRRIGQPALSGEEVRRLLDTAVEGCN